MKVFLFLLLSIVAVSALADQYVKPYVRKDGTYVEGHYRSSPNNSRTDNFSTQGNVNPYTGQKGYVDPYKLPDPPVGYGVPRQRSRGF